MQTEFISKITNEKKDSALDGIYIPNGCKHFYFYNYFIGMK